MNLKLDSDGDLVIHRGAVRVSGVEYVAQLISCKLKTLYGEWALNKTIGLPWFTDLLRHSINSDLLYRWIFSTLSSIEYITSVDELTLGVVKEERILLVHFRVSTIYGQLEKEVRI